MQLMKTTEMHKVLWLMVAVTFLSTLFLSLLYVPAGMDMSNCPFMTHEEVLCSMSRTDYLTAWKAAFIATMPTIALLLLVAVSLSALFSIIRKLLLSQRYHAAVFFRDVRERIYTFTYRPFQELFSSGIIHPKRF